MVVDNSFSCFIIGGDTLLIECAELVLARGHTLHGVITSAPRIMEWATSRGVRVVDSRGDYAAALREQQFDFLFAVTHLALLPDAVLALPRRFAINFHDGPLPRYAGLNAPAWALLNQETRYAITWHVVDAGVDTGDILLQHEVDLAPAETSLSLNTKCLEAGVKSFDELLEQLANGTEQRTPQPAQQSYFGRHARPERAALLDWTRPARELDALVRALDFGPYPNPLGVPKLMHDGRVFAVGRTSLISNEAPSAAAPGTVLQLSDETLTIQTGEGGLVLAAFSTLEGQPVPAVELGVRLGISVGSVLDSAAREHADELTRLNNQLARTESFWLRRLVAVEPLELPWAANQGSVDGSAGYKALELPGSAWHALRQRASGEHSVRDVAIAGIAAWLLRIAQKTKATIGYSSEQLLDRLGGFQSCFSSTVPLKLELSDSFATELARMRAELDKLRERLGFNRDLVARYPELQPQTPQIAAALESIVIKEQATERPADACAGSLVTFLVSDAGCTLYYDPQRIADDAAQTMADSLVAFLSEGSREPERAIRELPLLGPAERERISCELNRTEQPYPEHACVHELIRQQAARRPDATALVFEGQSLNYAELERRTNQLATHLRELGVGADSLVGVCVERSLELVIAALGVQKAGGAYVPLDPAYPVERIRFMLEDSEAGVLLTQAHLKERFPAHRGHVVCIDADWSKIAARPGDAPKCDVRPEHLAYVIYTSGSTGKPKGVMIEHRTVVNFFAGMDGVISHDPPGTWLAVTSLSFDISVLELFWTLARGFCVVVHLDRDREAGATQARTPSRRRLDFGLFYWGNDDGQGSKKYELLLEGAKIADKNGFNSVWTPERHFHAFGGPYPNPSVTGAAVAAVTKNLEIRAGSCVVPLHHPIRVAEEWAVVDNLSNGRVGLSLASGWQPDDFVLRPENAPPLNKGAMFRDIEIVRRLWRGETVEFEGPGGKQLSVVTQPRPVQRELPIWVTTAGNPDTYVQAAKVGANVLTHLLGQSLSEVADKIRIYRDALEANGRPRDSGKVTLMLHTFVGADRAEVKRLVREPMREYLRSATALIKQYAWAFPAFKRPANVNDPLQVDLQSLSAEELDAILEFAFERYFEDSGLFGTVDECLERAEELKAIGVDEVACLIDYGVPTPVVLEMLEQLSQVVQRANVAAGDAAPAEDDHSLPALIHRHGVTHLQCTPSMARMLTTHAEAREALGRLQHLMIGGEAFPPALAKELGDLVRGTITNMYGPTETTIWSAVQNVDRNATGNVPIGRPIANTQLYVLGADRELLPLGVPGELYIGGDGVARGYLKRPELTQERFVPDPFRKIDGARLYRTGDLVRQRKDGVLEFLGRTDHQVKVRGYRIELGEIEARLESHPAVQQAVVVAREDTPGDQRLVAYVIPAATRPTASELKEHVRSELPEYMVPSAAVVLDSFPLTPNGKVDRKLLPPPEQLEARVAAVYVPPQSQLEQTVAKIWQQILGRDKIGMDENFFDLGGHSLLVVRVHRELKQSLQEPVSLTDLYRFPTIRSLTSHLSSDGSSQMLQESHDRAEKRRELMQRRRRLQ